MFKKAKITILALFVMTIFLNGRAQTVTNTILALDYENNLPNSGISTINPTNATASDAVYVVQPGANSNYAIAHKIVHGDAGYISDGAYRSESDAGEHLPSRYYPGDERRYEFSVLLSDWSPSPLGNNTETNIFQLKVTGPASPVPLMIRTQGNEMRIRYADVTGPTIIGNVQPYIGQWIHFRIDALWDSLGQGYIKTYMKLPGDNDYILKDQRSNFNSFPTGVASNERGYIKWGLYIVPEGFTRIVYHDNIKIFELNNTSLKRLALWSNDIDNPPGMSVVPFSSALIRNHFTHPGIQNDAATGTPLFHFGAGNGGLTVSPQSNRVLLGGWTNSGGTPTSINPDQYYEFTMNINNGTLILDSLVFTARRGNVSDPGIYVLRSSLDGYTNNIGAPQLFTNTAATSLSYDLSAHSAVSGSVTFRMYWYGSTRTTGNALIGIDNFSFYGTNSYVLPLHNIALDAFSRKGQLFVQWTTLEETNISHFEIQVSEDGSSFTTQKVIASKNGNSVSPRAYSLAIPWAEIPLTLSVTFLFFTPQIRRKNKKVLLLYLCLSVLFLGACRKKPVETDRATNTLFVRIMQVDKEGKAQYSKVIKVRKH